MTANNDEISSEQCPKCRPEMGLHCSACTVNLLARVRPVQRARTAELQLCALRELVMARHAFKRAYDEFLNAIDPNKESNDCKSKRADIMQFWLDLDAPEDARELNEHDLATLRKRLLYA